MAENWTTCLSNNVFWYFKTLDVVTNSVSELQKRNLNFISVFTKEVLDNQGASLYALLSVLHSYRLYAPFNFTLLLPLRSMMLYEHLPSRSLLSYFQISTANPCNFCAPAQNSFIQNLPKFNLNFEPFQHSILLTLCFSVGFARIPPWLPPQSFPGDSFLRKLEFRKGEWNGQLHHRGQTKFPGKAGCEHV